MAITLRLIKGSELTYAEVDNNFKSLFYSSSFNGSELELFYYPGDVSQSINLTSLSTDTGSLLVTASIANGTITLTKGDGSTFDLVYNTGSFTGSFTGAITATSLSSIDLTVTGSIIMGDSNAPSLNDTTQSIATGGGNIIYSVPTSSYNGAQFFYTAQSASNARAGNIISTWIPGTSNIVFTETATTDIGSTSDVNFATILNGADMALTASVGSGTWTIKTTVQSI